MTRFLLLLAGAALWTGAAYVSETSQAPSASEIVALSELETVRANVRANAAERPPEPPLPLRTAESPVAAEPELEPEPELSRRLVIPFAPGYVTFEVATVAADIAEFTSRAKTDLDCLLAIRVYSAPEEVGARARFLANRRLELVGGVVRGAGVPERRIRTNATPETQSRDGIFAHVELEQIGDCQ